jgi:phosphoribosyl 1,2-cyclic phosphodiesterase
VLDAALGADMAVIEANHDVELLKNGAYPAFLKRRIFSDRGHLSNPDSAHFAGQLVRSGTKRIILAHLSRENNTPQLAYDTVAASIAETGASADGEIRLNVAPACRMGEVFFV